MATLFRDFSNTAVDAQPANTTLRRSASSGDYGRRDDDNEAVLRYRASSGGIAARGLQYDAVSSSGTVEVFGLARDQDETSPASLRMACFASDVPDNEYGAIVDALKDEIEIYKRINGSFSTLSEISKNIDPVLYYNARLQVVPGSPNELKLRVWDEGASEPSTWDITTTDNELDTTSGGWIGHIGFDESKSVLFKKVGIGTNGDAAPTTGATGSTVTDTALITSATTNPLTATETSAATDTATIISAAATPLTAVETAVANDTAQITAVSATPLTATATASATDTAQITSVTATTLTASETTSAAVTDTAVITSASATPLTAVESTIANDTAGITNAIVTTLVANENTGDLFAATSTARLVLPAPASRSLTIPGQLAKLTIPTGSTKLTLPAPASQSLVMPAPGSTKLTLSAD